MKHKETFYSEYGKRMFDLALALPALILFLPVLGGVALLVRLKLGGPVLFRQERPGLGGRPFTIFKFRSMTDAKDADGNLLPDAERLAGFGKFLRAASLDELPELWNVVKGDMSLVGPRPLLMEYLPLYNDFQYRRHELRPGVTGWAQIKGRNEIAWEEKFKLDVWYVDHKTLWIDMKILLMTLIKVFKRDGINAAGEATMEKFNPNPKSDIGV